MRARCGGHSHITTLHLFMPTVTIVYHSGSGHTRAMAEAVHAGAASVDGVTAQLVAIEGTDITEGRWHNDGVLKMLDASDAIIFGSPTYMGCVSGQMKAFLDATAERYFTRAWADKLAAGFTVSGGPAGDKLNTLVTLAVFAMQHGMIWIGQEQTAFNDAGVNRLVFHLGAAGQAAQEDPYIAPNAADKETGRRLGVRVAAWAKRLRA